MGIWMELVLTVRILPEFRAFRLIGVVTAKEKGFVDKGK